MVNDIKTECEDQKGINLEKLMKMMQEINGEANYDNRRLHYIERWTEEIEKNIQRGFKKEKVETESEGFKFKLPIEQNPQDEKVSHSKY